ncbi:MAG: nuclear transport factor 2 family protein [Bryobacteraceae bacterium]
MLEFAILPVLCAATAFGAESTSSVDKDAQEILAIERAAFERWAKGDPSGFLEASDPEVDYFDPFLDARLNGLDALRTLYGKLEGQVHLDHWEMINPRVIVSGEMGVLTFNFVGRSKAGTIRWNTTEVYRRKNGQWKIIHTHWSLVKPELAHPLTPEN